MTYRLQLSRTHVVRYLHVYIHMYMCMVVGILGGDLRWESVRCQSPCVKPYSMFGERLYGLSRSGFAVGTHTQYICIHSFLLAVIRVQIPDIFPYVVCILKPEIGSETLPYCDCTCACTHVVLTQTDV